MWEASRQASFLTFWAFLLLVSMILSPMRNSWSFFTSLARASFKVAAPLGTTKTTHGSLVRPSSSCAQYEAYKCQRRLYSESTCFEAEAIREGLSRESEKVRGSLKGQAIEEVLRRLAGRGNEITEEDVLIGGSKLNANLYLSVVKNFVAILKLSSGNLNKRCNLSEIVDRHKVCHFVIQYIGINCTRTSECLRVMKLSFIYIKYVVILRRLRLRAESLPGAERCLTRSWKRFAQATKASEYRQMNCHSVYFIISARE
jgi:hypothetical protein